MNIYFDKDYNLLISTKEEQIEKTYFLYADDYMELVKMFGLSIIKYKEREIPNLKPNFYKWNVITLRWEEMNLEEKEAFLKIMERKTKEFLIYAQTLYTQTEKLMREE